jgi:uncharacterized protein (DUF934 family)
MPRQLLRDGRVVADDWTFLADIEDLTPVGTVPSAVVARSALSSAPSASATRSPVGTVPASIIIPFDRWQSERDRWREHTGRLGIVLQPVHKVEALAPDLARFELVASEFPGPADGRGYTQGRLLRERYQFTGELRATGYVRRDQLFFLARCGFNSFQLAENELATAPAAYSTFSAEYQPSNDEGLARKLQRR